MAKTLFLIFFSIIFLDATGQSANNNSSLTFTDTIKPYCREWANLGFGTTSDKVFNSISGYDMGVDYHWMPKRITYQVGANATNKYISGANLNAINAGIGKSLITKEFLICLVGGPGLMWGKNFEENRIDGISFVRVGLSVNAELIVKLIKNFGIGTEFYLNMNEVQNSSGFRVVIHLNNDK